MKGTTFHGFHVFEPSRRNEDSCLESGNRVRQAFQPDLEVLDLSREAEDEVDGRNALLRVRDGKPNTDAEHRAPYRITFIRSTEFLEEGVGEETPS